MMSSARSEQSFQFSVILCTYNPRPDFFAIALRSVGAQQLDMRLWEFLVVDNNSNPPLDQERLQNIAGIPLRVVQQPKQGLTHARIAGIEATRSPWIVFVDDDNELAPDYLQRTAEITTQQSNLGAFGGVSEGVLETSIGKFKTGFLPQLGVRNNGEERIEGTGNEWGLHEPIGAGLVVKRDVASAFVDFIDKQSIAKALGRTGTNLMSGEDSLFSRLADDLGLLCAYEPSLRLRHYMSAPRLKAKYLSRLVYGHGRSYVLLERSLGRSIDPPERSRFGFALANFRHRLRTEKFGAALGMIPWDIGFYDQAKEQP